MKRTVGEILQGRLLSLGYRSQVWCPYTLLNTIDLCTSPLLLYEVGSMEQVTSD